MVDLRQTVWECSIICAQPDREEEWWPRPALERFCEDWTRPAGVVARVTPVDHIDLESKKRAVRIFKQLCRRQWPTTWYLAAVRVNQLSAPTRSLKTLLSQAVPKQEKLGSRHLLAQTAQSKQRAAQGIPQYLNAPASLLPQGRSNTFFCGPVTQAKKRR